MTNPTLRIIEVGLLLGDMYIFERRFDNPREIQVYSSSSERMGAVVVCIKSQQYYEWCGGYSMDYLKATAKTVEFEFYNPPITWEP